MISKAKSIAGSIASVDYIMNDKENGKAEILDRNGIVGNNGKEIMSEFRMVQNCNDNCKKNTISIVISPSNERKFTSAEMRTIGIHHLKQLGLDKNQYLMTMHTSTGKPHIHIIANRIDSNGKALNDSYISKKIQRISEELDKKLGLTTAKEMSQIRKQELQPIKQEISQANKFAIRNSKTFTEYRDLMQSKGIKVIPTLNKKGEMQGFKILHKASGLDFKASEIGKNMSVKSLSQGGVKFDIPLTPSLHNVAKISFRIIKEVINISRGGMSMGM
uniref:relaxase/mobilization nuclease domain-containing protein n=1 Tax=Ornithobacterium rhinotracheale TaxID=28251 RepID=UPI0039A53AC7